MGNLYFGKIIDKNIKIGTINIKILRINFKYIYIKGNLTFPNFDTS